MIRKDPYLVVYCGYEDAVKSFLTKENIPLQTEVSFPADLSELYTTLNERNINLLLIDDLFSEVQIHPLMSSLVSKGHFLPYAVIDTGQLVKIVRPLIPSPLAVLRPGETLKNRLEMLIYNMFGQAELKLQLEYLISAWYRSEDDFLFLSSHIPYAVWIRDSETYRYKYVNKMGEKIIGIPVDTLLSRSTEYLLNLPCGSLIASFIQDDLQRIFSGDDSQIIRYYETSASGGEGNNITFANVSAMVRDKNGKWLCLGLSKSMLKQISFDYKIREVNERFQQTIEVAPVPILVFKYSGMIYANASAAKMLDADNKEKLYSYALKDFVHSDYHQIITHRLSELVNNKHISESEQVWITLSKREVNVEVRSTRVELFSEDIFIVFALDITARKKAEKEIFDRNRYIRELYRLTPYALGVIRNMKLVEANDRFFEMTGYSPDELIGETLEKVHVNRDEYFTIAQTRSQVLTEGILSEMESRYKKKDGSIFDVIIRRTSAPSLGDDTIIFCAVDISILKKTERELLGKNSFIRDLYRLSPIGLGIMNKGILIDGNDSLFELTEYAPDELLGETFEKLHVSQEDFNNFRVKIASQISPTGFAEQETRYITKNGATRDVIARMLYTPSLGEGMMIFSVIDITRLRNAERELLSIYEDAPVAMMLLDYDLNVRRANRAAVDFSGSHLSEEANQHVGTFIKCSMSAKDQNENDCSVCELFSILNQIKQSELPVLNADIKIELSDGSFIKSKTLSVSLSKMTILGEQLILFCFNDVSEKRMFESRINQLQKLELTGKIASGAAHDFNNVLAAISLHLSSLIDSELTESKMKQELSLMNDYVDRGCELTKRLLSLGHSNTCAEQSFSINNLMQDLLIMIRKMSGRKIRINILSPCNDIIINADKVMIEQMILNLSLNGRDAMPEGGVLIIETKFASEKDLLQKHLPEIDKTNSHILKISVTDTGVGIDPKIKDRIFEPFFSTKHSGDGGGLGLSIVKNTVDKYNGWIDVQSEAGKGTSISVYLPSVIAK